MLIQELTLQGILSFGPDTPPIKMCPLNVLIGPNGSGKSNLLESIGLLRSSPSKLTAPLRRMGGVSEWFWKGADRRDGQIGIVVNAIGARYPLRHCINLVEMGSRLMLWSEGVESIKSIGGHIETVSHYRFEDGNPEIFDNRGEKESLTLEDIVYDESILSQRKDPNRYRELGMLAFQYERIRIYRDWSFGRKSVFRTPQPADMPSDRLEEDFSNLGMFLNRLRSVPKAKNAIISHLRDLYAGLDDFDVRVQGGTVEVFLTEGDFIIPASRLSDGTLRYLCLLAILCDPDPPPLVCIEEPELGLHPDILPKLADLMISASERMQLIVTTHSDILVDAMTETPESVVVFEKHDGKTEVKRLQNTDEMKHWLSKYRLGELWTRGEIGGVRW